MNIDWTTYLQLSVAVATHTQALTYVHTHTLTYTLLCTIVCSRIASYTE